MSRPDPAAAMPFDAAHLSLPFYEQRHRALADELTLWVGARRAVVEEIAAAAPVEAAREMARLLARDGWLKIAVEGDLRSACLCREAFAWLHDLCDFAFALQGLTAHPLKAGGRADLAADLASARAIGSFALTEPDIGSDLAGVAATARAKGDGYVIDGEKCWIGHAGAADLVVALVRTGGPGAYGLTLVAIDAVAPGVTQAADAELIAPRAIGRFVFNGVEIGAKAVLGEEGQGFALAADTLDAFRMTVGAAAIGFARRGLQSAVAHARQRRVEGRPLAEKATVRAEFADMATMLNAAALTVAQAAWERDADAPTAAARSSLAKICATEAAQIVVDRALQLHGAAGLASGATTERLYREIRSLRLYEGATEVLKQLVGRAVATGRL